MEIWKETEHSLVSRVTLNGKRDDKGDMEREREMGGGGDKREICVLFHYSLWSSDILGGSQRAGRAFSFPPFVGFVFFFLAVSPNQPLHFTPPSSFPLPSLLSLVSTSRWKFDIILICPFCLGGN